MYYCFRTRAIGIFDKEIKPLLPNEFEWAEPKLEQRTDFRVVVLIGTYDYIRLQIDIYDDFSMRYVFTLTNGENGRTYKISSPHSAYSPSELLTDLDYVNSYLIY